MEYRRKNSCYLIFFLIAFLAVVNPAAFCHTEKIKAVVDTDMSLDDIRTLAMLLNSDVLDISLIICSEGSTTPDVGVVNVQKILHFLKRQSITVIPGKKINNIPPFWRNMVENLQLPETKTSSYRIDTKEPISSHISKYIILNSDKVTYLCLGPLTNLADALKDTPELKDRIDKVVFYGASPDIAGEDFNYTYDTDSAKYVFDSGLDIYTIRVPENNPIIFSNEMLEQIKSLGSLPADLISYIHETPRVAELIRQSHLKVWDELIAIYLFKPSLFNFEDDKMKPNIKMVKDMNYEEIKRTFYQLLSNPEDKDMDSREPVILNSYPMESKFFKSDVKPYIKDIIERHGIEEWKACLLTNELHRHLGIYSILGAKMGMRAREILGAPFDELEVVSFAGLVPPLSCLNDGLQVSTGASLGRGTIKVNESSLKPQADFIFRKKKLTLKLKGEILAQIEADIKSMTEKYGQSTQEYYFNFRELAIKYWLEMDRKSIFEEIE